MVAPGFCGRQWRADVGTRANQGTALADVGYSKC